MSKSTVQVLCPSGHRRKAQVSPNSNLLQVLEEMCQQEALDASEWGLIHQRNKCDLTIPWRMLNIPTNAVLEMHQLDARRPTDDINLQLQLPDNSRYSGWFEPTVTLQEMLDWYRVQPESMVAALDISMSDGHDLCPVCSYLGEEIMGDYALSNTTLRELGLTSGTAVIRYNLRPVSDKELHKANGRIDEKIVRQQQQPPKPKQEPPPPPAKAKQEPKPAPTTRSSTTSDSARSLVNTTASSATNEEYSIFRDRPPAAAQPSSTRSQQQQQSMTLAEELGVNLSLEPEGTRHTSQNEFRNFKFPEATRGKDLYHNDAEDDYRHTQKVKPCERRPIAYDLTKIRPARENKDSKAKEPSDNFYELTSEDLRSVLDTLHKQGSNEIPLETQAMRNQEQSSSGLVYEQIAIRFVVNSRYILQGLFRPEEPVSRLVEFARANLVCPHLAHEDFYLYTSPPRLVLSDLRKPLSAYQLAPAANVHLGHRTVSPLNVQLAPNVPIRTLEEAHQLASHYVFNRARPMTGRDQSALYNDRPASATSLVDRPVTRNPPTRNIDDKQLRDKLRKFLPSRK